MIKIILKTTRPLLRFLRPAATWLLSLFSAYEGGKLVLGWFKKDVEANLFKNPFLLAIAAIIVLFSLAKFLPAELNTNKSFSLLITFFTLIALPIGYFGYYKLAADVKSDIVIKTDKLYSKGMIQRSDLFTTLGYNSTNDVDRVAAIKTMIIRQKNNTARAMLDITPAVILNEKKGLFYSAICYKNDNILEYLLSNKGIKNNEPETYYKYYFGLSKAKFTPLEIALAENNETAIKLIYERLKKDNVPLPANIEEKAKKIIESNKKITSNL